MADPLTNETEVHEMQCMEVWGGSHAVDTGVSVPGIDAYVWSRPHSGPAGGDIHYVSLCGHGMLSRYVVADVAGHGEPVAGLAETLRGLMHDNANTVDVAAMAREVNVAFGELSASGIFATAIIGTYYAPEKHLLLCNAGHPRPLWHSAAEGTWRLLKHDVPAAREADVADLPLGVIPQTPYRQFAVPLTKGDLIVLYTDSLIEATDPTGRALGEGGLLAMTADQDPRDAAAFTRQLLAALESYRGGDAWHDDVTLLVLHHNAVPPHALED